jgi:outer membrane protein assembly factor BamB
MKTSYSVTTCTLFFAILLSVVAFEADIIAQSINESLVTKQAKLDDSVDPNKFEFSISDTKYLVLSNGSCVKVDSRGKSWNFSLPLDDKFHIERVDYVDREGDLIIIYGVTDEDVGGGRVIRIDKTTLKKKWLTIVPGFNIGEAIVKDHCLYLTAFGFVGKLDLETGRYIWKYENLYKKKPGIFNAFKRPVIEKDLVRFTEWLPPNSKGSPVTIVINDHTGKILTPRF